MLIELKPQDVCDLCAGFQSAVLDLTANDAGARAPRAASGTSIPARIVSGRDADAAAAVKAPGTPRVARTRWEIGFVQLGPSSMISTCG